MPKWWGIAARLAIVMMIGAAQCLALFELYRVPWLDMLRFFMPPIAAFWLSLLVLEKRWHKPSPVSSWTALWIAIGATALSWYVGMLITVNTFGT